MGVRISNLPNQPSIKETDFLVVDSTDGTRKVPINESLALSGVTSPKDNEGVLGSMYVQYNTSGLVAVYFKTPDGWEVPASAASDVTVLKITEGTESNSTITIAAEVTQ